MKAATAESNRPGAWGPRHAEVAETESGVLYVQSPRRY